MAKRSKKKKKPPEGQVRRVKVAEPKETVPVREIPPNDFPASHWLILVQALTIAAAVLWIYWPALRGGWLWDDDSYLTDNPLLREPNRLWNAWFQPGSFIEYYPIQETVQWAQWHLWGLDPLGYHVTNVVLHLMSALLVWRLLSKFGLRLAWLGGLIFAIHPAQVESVAWISELKNTLSLPPFLLAMCAWIDYEEEGRKADYLLALGLFLIAMLCKITMAPFPLLILLFAWWKSGQIGWRDVAKSGPFWCISLALGFTTIWAGQNYLEHNHAGTDAVPLGGALSRLAAAGLSLSFYFSKCFLPVNLMPVYPQWTVDPPDLWQFLPWLAFGVAIYWLWTKRQSWGKHVLLGLAFFILFLAPFLGFRSISYMSFSWVMDHFLYLPSIGLIGLVVAGLGQVEDRLSAPMRLCGKGLVVVILVVLALGSRSYAKKFLSEETLWTYELKHNPGACLAYNNLGLALLKAGQSHEAIEQFEKAIQIRPDYAEAHNNFGDALRRAGRMPEAMEQFEQALEIMPDYAEAHNNLGDALRQTGHIPEAMEQFNQAFQIKPDYAEAHYNLGLALFQSGRMLDAIDQYQQALQIKPDYAEAHNNLGNTMLQIGELSDAIEQFEQALQIKPDYAEAHNNLGAAFFHRGQMPDAIEQFKQALLIDPGFSDARDNLSKVQALQKAAQDGK
jgi:tetratricopeptide (TPR) repeat protein